LFNAYGGAICHDGSALTIQYSCFHHCGADTWGLAIHFSNKNGVKQFLDSSFINCYYIEDYADGTINDQYGSISGQTTHYERLNFTDCQLHTHENHGDGIVVHIAKSECDGFNDFRYLTVLKCTGSSLWYSCSKNRPTVYYCNLYANTAPYGHFYAETNGFDINYCIFEPYINYPILYLEKKKALLFIIWYNVFTWMPVPSDTTMISTSYGNKGNTATESYRIAHFWTTFCPTPSFSRSQSPSRTLTLPKTYEGPSPSPAATVPPTLTDSPTVSPEETPTASVSQTWYCEIYIGARTPIVARGVFCVEVRDSLFINTTAEFGGGVCIWNPQPTVNISDSTFHLCDAVDGGAIDVSGSVATVYRCCFSATIASNAGSAISLSYGQAPADICELNFVACGDEDVASGGTVSDASGFRAEYDLLNFSFCAVAMATDGSVLRVVAPSATWSFAHCTVVGCRGLTGLRSESDTPCLVTFCNFCDNIVEPNRGLLSCYRIGMVVVSCVFNNNTDLFAMDLPTAETGFRVSGCFFSEELPNESYYSETADNCDETQTRSLDLSHFHTEYCPAAPYVTPATKAFQGSKPVEPSGVIPNTPALLESSAIEPSNAAVASGSPALSAAFSGSQTVLVTSNVGNSVGFADCQTVLLTVGFGQSAGNFSESRAVLITSSFGQSDLLTYSAVIAQTGALRPSIALLSERFPDSFPFSGSIQMTLSAFFGGSGVMKASGSIWSSVELPVTLLVVNSAALRFGDSSHFAPSPLISVSAALPFTAPFRETDSLMTPLPSNRDSSQSPTSGPGTDSPSQEPTSESPSQQPTSESSTQEPTSASPSQDQSSQSPGREPSSESSSHETATGSPRQEPTSGQPTDEPTSEFSTQDPTLESPTQEPTAETPSEEPISESPTEERSPESPSERPLPEPPHPSRSSQFPASSPLLSSLGLVTTRSFAVTGTFSPTTNFSRTAVLIPPGDRGPVRSATSGLGLIGSRRVRLQSPPCCQERGTPDLLRRSIETIR
jgi:hypothetical protein